MAVPIIRSSSEIRKDYNSIERLAIESGQPVYLTKNGRASLVVIDANTFDYDAYLAQEVARAEAHNAVVKKSYALEDAKAEVLQRARAKGLA